VEEAKALVGSFILVTPAPKPVREMSQLSGNSKRIWTHEQIKAIQTNIQNTNLG